jgi:quercetin dioxygenase-like cupin family protein
MCTEAAVHVILTPAQMKWTAAPPTLPDGVKVTVIEGDPGQAGVFTMRLSFPAGARVEPHFHPGIEHGTVLSGAVSIGIGEVFAVEKLKRMPAGSFMVIPAGSPHFGIVEEDTIIQAHGIGPWQTTYVHQAR